MEGEKCRVSDPVPVGYTIYAHARVFLFSARVLPHMRILPRTRMGRPIRVRDIPYAYRPI